jgi:ATP-binding cassette subfamily B protein
LSELTSITQETLSVSGILLAKSFNRQRAESERYRAENTNQVRLQVRRAMSGQGFFAVVQVLMSSVPAVIYVVAGWLIVGGDVGITAGAIVAFTNVQARLLNPLSPHAVALDLQTSRALFAASSNTSTGAGGRDIPTRSMSPRRPGRGAASSSTM